MIRQALLLAMLISSCVGASASCDNDGKSSQSIMLSIEGKRLGHWQPTNDIHRTRLPNGFDVGIQILPATAEKYRELFAKTKRSSFDELVCEFAGY